MLVQPSRRARLITRLRQVAITCGARPVEIWEWSSSKVTSRTQCRRFSMPQYPGRQCVRRRAAVVSGGNQINNLDRPAGFGGDDGAAQLSDLGRTDKDDPVRDIDDLDAAGPPSVI